MPILANRHREVDDESTHIKVNGTYHLVNKSLFDKCKCSDELMMWVKTH
jgi:hypothetical protein